MAYQPTDWKNREVERPRTFKLHYNDDETVTLIPAEGKVTEPGTPIMAVNMNKIENQLVYLDESIDNGLFTIHEVNPPWLERIDDFYLSTGTYRMNTTFTDAKPTIKNDLPIADNKTGTLVVLPSGEYGWGIIQIWAGITTRSLYYRMGLNATSFSPWIKINTDDTGWLNATEGPDWGTPSGGFLQYRRVGDLVYFRGMTICFGSITTTMTTLPVGFRPRSSSYIASSTGYIIVTSAGHVLAGGGLQANKNIYFDGVFSIA